jgi:hypothetical protein
MKKYVDNRADIKQGDIILFRGNAFISRGIRWLDNAPYNHAAVVFEAHGRKLVLESTGHGVNPRFLSVVMEKEKYTNFCIIRPKAWTEDQMLSALNATFDSAEKVINYDHLLLAQIAIKRLFDRTVEWKSQRMDICSEFARRYARSFPDPKADNFEMPRMPNSFITPWDFVLYAEPNFEVLWDDYKPTMVEQGFRVRGGLEPM